MTIVVVSHDMQSLYHIADHALILNDKKIAFSGSLSELQNSSDPFTARFLDRDKAAREFAPEARYALSKNKRDILRTALNEWMER